MVHLGKKIHVVVVIAKITADPGALRHPVQPDALIAIMYFISLDQHIDGCMDLDASHFSAPIGPVSINVIHIVVKDLAICGPEAATYPGSSAIIDRIATYQMGFNGRPAPAIGGYA